MPSIVQSKNSKTIPSSLLYTLPLGAVAGLMFHVLFFNVLLENAFIGHAHGVDGFIIAVLLTAAFTDIFMVIAIAASGLVALWGMHYFNIFRAARISVVASVILTVVWYLLIRFNLDPDSNMLWQSIVSFTIVYGVCSFIALKK